MFELEIFGRRLTKRLHVTPSVFSVWVLRTAEAPALAELAIPARLSAAATSSLALHTTALVVVEPAASGAPVAASASPEAAIFSPVFGDPLLMPVPLVRLVSVLRVLVVVIECRVLVPAFLRLLLPEVDIVRVGEFVRIALASSFVPAAGIVLAEVAERLVVVAVAAAASSLPLLIIAPVPMIVATLAPAPASAVATTTPAALLVIVTVTEVAIVAAAECVLSTEVPVASAAATIAAALLL